MVWIKKASGFFVTIDLSQAFSKGIHGYCDGKNER
ncbi:MAG: hypothetical protein RLZZ24_1277 [Pseudomonadota bacterium]